MIFEELMVQWWRRTRHTPRVSVTSLGIQLKQSFGELAWSSDTGVREGVFGSN